jgi:hypothetical protein
MLMGVGGGLIALPDALAQRADGSEAQTSPAHEGRTALSTPASEGQTAKRYLVTFMHSAIGETIRSATVVTATNQAGIPCAVQVDWFRGFESTPACTIALDLETDVTADFCSRDLPESLTSCNAACVPELTLHEGRAVVSSSASDEAPQCAEIGVSARVYYTTGDQDEVVSAITDAKIVRVGQGNRGD